MAQPTENVKGSETLNSVAENIGRAIGHAAAGVDVVKSGATELATDARTAMATGQEKAAAVVVAVKKRASKARASGSKAASISRKAAGKQLAKARKGAGKAVKRVAKTGRKVAKAARRRVRAVVKRGRKVLKRGRR